MGPNCRDRIYSVSTKATAKIIIFFIRETLPTLRLVRTEGLFREGIRTIKHRMSHQMFRRYNEFKPVNSRMFQLEDTVLLFDFDYKAVHCFTLGADLLWRADIQIELVKDFNGRVHFDPISKRFFLEFTNAQLTYLIEIDPQTGEELQTIPINKFKHIDHISIYENRAFFLHQPDFGDRGKKIYYLDI